MEARFDRISFLLWSFAFLDFVPPDLRIQETVPKYYISLLDRNGKRKLGVSGVSPARKDL